MSALGYELNDEQRIDLIRAAHKRYLARTVGAIGRFEAGDASRAGFDLKLATELVSPTEWSDELNLDHVEIDEAGGE